MIGRVTQRSLALNSLNNLQASQVRSAKLQDQMTSGKAYAKPSEDPVAAAAALRLRAQASVNGEHGRNIADAQAWQESQEGALTGALKELQRARDLTVQAASTGNTDARGRAGVAAELREIKNSLLAAANTSHQGRPVFGGTTSAELAYDPVTYQSADDGGSVKRAVGPGPEMAVNVSGTSVFGDGASSVFADIDRLIAAVTSGDSAATSAELTTIDSRLSSVTGALATVGARVNQLDAANAALESRSDLVTAQLDEVEGVDLAKTLVEFNLQNVAYQAALQSTAKVVQPTLLDFLR